MLYNFKINGFSPHASKTSGISSICKKITGLKNIVNINKIYFYEKNDNHFNLSFTYF